MITTVHNLTFNLTLVISRYLQTTRKNFQDWMGNAIKTDVKVHTCPWPDPA